MVRPPLTDKIWPVIYAPELERLAVGRTEPGHHARLPIRYFR
jgi:hypothetical protein